MGRPKKEEAAATEPTEGKKVQVRPKNAGEWMQMLKTAEEQHWRKIKVTIKVRGKLYAGKPAQLDAAKAMLAARGLQDVIDAHMINDPNAMKRAAEKAGVGEVIVLPPKTAEETAEKAGEVVNEGLCEFHRREEAPGIWMPSNNVKAMWKESWSVLGLRQEIRGSRGALAEGVFIWGVSADPNAAPLERDWIALGSAPHGIDMMVSHTMSPRGPVSSIKRHEFVLRPEITFVAAVAHAIEEKLPDDKLASMLVHAGEHGLGACRSQGHGRFDLLKVEDLVE